MERPCKSVLKEIAVTKIGFYVSLFSVILILLWLGAFKFTNAEAEAIRPLIAHHPLTFWVYSVMSVEVVSAIVGVAELLVATVLLFSLWFPRLQRYGAIGMMVIFFTTLTFLFTTPDTWQLVKGFPITDFFILKDTLFLGFGIMLYGNSLRHS